MRFNVVKHAGSFSVTTLAVQSLGGIGMAIYLSTAGSKLSTSLPPFVTGCFQLVLLGILYKFSRKDRPILTEGTGEETRALVDQD